MYTCAIRLKKEENEMFSLSCMIPGEYTSRSTRTEVSFRLAKPPHQDENYAYFVFHADDSNYEYYTNGHRGLTPTNAKIHLIRWFQNYRHFLEEKEKEQEITIQGFKNLTDDCSLTRLKELEMYVLHKETENV